mmetsp:Transcript_20047/g.47131  ORF Transcript_20047/g.47131 Transcript_20047/m.47131 type:complete len:589 (+) Transcript_20047:83-1849(+)
MQIPMDFGDCILEQKQELLRLLEEQHDVFTAAVEQAFHEVQSHPGASSPSLKPGIFEVAPTGKPTLPDTVDPCPAPADPDGMAAATSPSESAFSDDAGMNTTITSSAVSPVPSAPLPAPDLSQPNNWEEPKRRTSQRSQKSWKSKVPTMNLLLAESRNREQWDAMMQQVQKYIDYVAGFLVLVNSFVLMLQLELEGRAAAESLGLPEGQRFDDILPAFRTVDTAFVFIFTLELLLRVAVERTKVFHDLANWLDIVLVAGGLVDIFLSPPWNNASQQDAVTLRFVTALKAFRAIRMVRSFRFFRGLRMLVKACQCCLPSLCWSMVLLAVFMCMGALILGNLLQDFIKDETQSLEDRIWVWTHYGTAYRATYTLYEVTFAGNWPTNARPVLERVSQAFVIFYLLYITIIVFAVIRVISAIFLKDTLDEAHNDAQHLVLDRIRKKAEYVERLEGVFKTLDVTGRGTLSEQVLNHMLANPKVKAYFQTLEVDVQEGTALFHLLDNGDGEVTLDEFIDGIMRCKGPARAIDTVALQSDVKQLDNKVTKLIRQMKDNKLIRSKSQAEGSKNRPNLKVFRIDQSEVKFAPAANSS